MASLLREAMSDHIYTYYDSLKAAIFTQKGLTKNVLHKGCFSCHIWNIFGAFNFLYCSAMLSFWYQGQMQTSRRFNTDTASTYEIGIKTFEYFYGVKTDEIFLTNRRNDS